MSRLAPLSEEPINEDDSANCSKKGLSWKNWLKTHLSLVFNKKSDLKILLSVLGCPLFPVSALSKPPINEVSSSAQYIIQHFTAATGCRKSEGTVKNIFVTGKVTMAMVDELGATVGSVAGAAGVAQKGCFVMWQMVPNKWLIELVVGGHKVIAGSDGNVAWRRTPWLGAHAAKGGVRPLRRALQGLDPMAISAVFSSAQYMGEKRISSTDCFVLKLSADQVDLADRSDSTAEMIKHVIFGYFSQRSGLLVFLEDSYLTRIQSPGTYPTYWETTMATKIEDYRLVEGSDRGEENRQVGERRGRDKGGEQQLPLVTILVTAFRKSVIGCSISGSKELCAMEIGLPTNVKHVAHVTFDRFHGFLGLPVEFEPEVPRKAPSASANVFGVSTESMQLSFDCRGNSVPTILLLMQRHLYDKGGLQAEGIFRINAENSQEEYVREQLNRGVIPDGIDVHCLAGLIKAWFRELPSGVLDSLPPELVIKSQSEEECAQLVRLLPPTEAALLDWTINLMADVVELEHLNKMNARNVAMVFAPNMTQLSDPLTALMHAVQVMNFLKTLIIRTLKARQDSMVDCTSDFPLEPSDKNGPQSSSQLCNDVNNEVKNECEGEKSFVPTTERNSQSLASIENISAGNRSLVDNHPCIMVSREGSLRSSSESVKKGLKKANERSMVDRESGLEEKSKGTRIVNRVNSRAELCEAWR